MKALPQWKNGLPQLMGGDRVAEGVKGIREGHHACKQVVRKGYNTHFMNAPNSIDAFNEERADSSQCHYDSKNAPLGGSTYFNKG